MIHLIKFTMRIYGKSHVPCSMRATLIHEIINYQLIPNGLMIFIIQGWNIFAPNNMSIAFLPPTIPLTFISLTLRDYSYEHTSACTSLMRLQQVSHTSGRDDAVQ